MTSEKKTAAKREGSEELSFSEGIGELEAILGRIEGQETDIDALAGELGRAAKLLELCRGKLRRAELEVTQIVQGLEGEGDEADEGEPKA